MAKKKTGKSSGKSKETADKKAASRRRKQDDMVINLPTLELENYEVREEDAMSEKEKLAIGSKLYGWIGSGQCGGRLVKSFFDLGYDRCIALNTAYHDLDLLDLPDEQKFLMDIGVKGAGKDMSRGKEAAELYSQEIIHLAEETFAKDVDHIMLCIGAGGGTGGGSAVSLVKILKHCAKNLGFSNPNRHVGVIATLPTRGEVSTPKVGENAHEVVTALSEMAMNNEISPLIIIDNDKINQMYPSLTVKSFWPTINHTVAGLFDIFNKLSTFSSAYTSFDSVDYNSIIESGGCAIMGLTKVKAFSRKYDISEAVKRNLEKTLLAGSFDLKTAKAAGSIVVGGRSIMANTKGLQDNINYAFDVLADIIGSATLHRGIYEDEKDGLRVYTIIGGMNPPLQRVEELQLSQYL